MFRKLLASAVFVLFSCGMVFGKDECPIIPLPQQCKAVNESFIINDNTPVIVQDEAFKTAAYYFKNHLLTEKGVTLSNKKRHYPAIIFKKGNVDKGTKGGYRLEMSADKIVITAANDKGAFNGMISLLQLAVKSKKKHHQLKVACWDIEDYPLYTWRGFMLDESRHFFGKKVVKEVLDQMAWLKLNRFHWHLTDAPGWRLQIKGYPLLTLVGGIGNYSDPYAPARYYTQEDIREIVTYARARHIKIIPEIDMPGHATAANRAYPEFSGGGTGKYANFTFNPGKDSTYQYLTNILKEVSVLFPSGMIHLGGDEVAYGIKSWNQDKSVKKLMKMQGFTQLKQVERYFFNRMVDSSLKNFKKVLAWDEAVDGSLSKDRTIIFWWRHNKPDQLKKALSKGYQVVLCPRIPMYFDFVQNESHIDGRRWAGKFSTVKQVYGFSDTTYAAGKEDPQLILGMQGNLWTETVKTEKRLEFLLFPRMDALSEAAWTRASRKDYQGFLSRLKEQLKLYRQENIYFYNPIAPEKTPEVVD